MNTHVELSLDKALTDEYGSPAEPRLYRNNMKFSSHDIVQVSPVVDKDELARRAQRSARFGHVDPLSSVSGEPALPDTLPPPPAVYASSPEQIRACAVYLHSHALQQLDTRKVLRFFNSLLSPQIGSAFQGVEWIDDTSLCLRFSSIIDAANGFSCLVQTPFGPDDLNQLTALLEQVQSASSSSSGLVDDSFSREEEPPLPPNTAPLVEYRQAHPFPPQLALKSPSNDDDSFSTSLLPPTFPSFIRFALHTDIKQRNAASKSQFYAKEGLQAGRLIRSLPGTRSSSPKQMGATAKELSTFANTVLGARIGGRTSKRGRDERLREELDADLEDISMQTDEDVFNNNSLSQRFGIDDLDEEQESTDARKDRVANRILLSSNNSSVDFSTWDDVPLKPDERGEFPNDDPLVPMQPPQAATISENAQNSSSDLFSRIR